MKRALSLLLLLIYYPFVSYADDSGTATAPLTPVCNTTVTVCASGCTYTSIQAAINAASAGYCIDVKNGIYTSGGTNSPVANLNRAGTPSAPITLRAAPGHAPIIDCTGDGNGGTALQPPYGSSTNGVVALSRNNSRWWIVEGFEIRGCWYGVRLVASVDNYSFNMTIRNNTIHDNGYDGINPTRGYDIYIADNDIYENGIGSDECLFNATGQASPSGTSSPSHCHAVYLSSGGCFAFGRTTIRRNQLRRHGGGGVHLNPVASPSCTAFSSDILVENNLILDNQFGIIVEGPVSGAVIRNNTIVLSSPPAVVNTTQNGYYTMFWSCCVNDGVAVTQVQNNIFYATQSSFVNNGVTKPLYAFYSNWQTNTTSTRNFAFNFWSVPVGTKWLFNGTVRNDFIGEFETITGWESNPTPVIDSANPLFVGATDFHIQSTSPARNAGSNTMCTAEDFDQQTRPSETTCDIGMDEFIPPATPSFSVQDVKWLDVDNCANPEASTPRTTALKGTPYCICVKATHSGGHDANVAGVRYLFKDTDATLVGTLDGAGLAQPDRTKNLRIFYSFSRTGSSALTAYITEGSVMGTLVGNTDWSWGTNGGGEDLLGPNGFYETSGRIAVDANTRWHCAKIKPQNEIPDGLVEDQAVLELNDGSLSALYTEQTVSIQTPSNNPPNLVFDRFGSDTISGCPANQYMWTRASPSLRVTFSPNGANTISSATFKCTEGCTTGSTPVSSGVPFTPTLVNGRNTIQVTVVDSANQVTVRECRIELIQWTMKLGQ